MPGVSKCLTRAAGSIFRDVDAPDRAILAETRRTAVRAGGHDQVHPAIVLQIRKDRRCCRGPITRWHTTLYDPRHRLTLVVEEQKRQCYFINASAVLGEICSNQQILATIPVEVGLPNVGEPDAATNGYHCRPRSLIIVAARDPQRPVGLRRYLNVAERNRSH